MVDGSYSEQICTICPKYGVEIARRKQYWSYRPAQKYEVLWFVLPSVNFNPASCPVFSSWSIKEQACGRCTSTCWQKALLSNSRIWGFSTTDRFVWRTLHLINKLLFVVNSITPTLKYQLTARPVPSSCHNCKKKKKKLKMEKTIQLPQYRPGRLNLE